MLIRKIKSSRYELKFRDVTIKQVQKVGSVFETLVFERSIQKLTQCAQKQKNNSLEIKEIEMWFYRRIMRIPWTGRIIQKEVLNKMATERTNTQKKKKQLKFVWIAMRTEGLENLTLTGHIEGKLGGRQRVT